MLWVSRGKGRLVEQTRGPGLAETLITAALVVGLMWWQIPEWQRQLILRRIRSSTRQIIAHVARKSGHRAMGDELAGRKAEADAGYQFTERLSRARDAL